MGHPKLRNDLDRTNDVVIKLFQVRGWDPVFLVFGPAGATYVVTV
jgi:hypothetical protein